MGFLDDLLGSDKREYKKTPAPIGGNLKEVSGLLNLSIRFHPLRLSAKKDNQIDMLVTIENRSQEQQLVSFEAFLPPKEMLGFDKSAIGKHFEKKLGNLESGAKSDFTVPLFATSMSRPGNYQMGIVANIHFMDYTKIMPTGIKRKILVRVV